MVGLVPALLRQGFGGHFPFRIGKKNGGAEGNQTPDLFIANEALYQLSYSPKTKGGRFCVIRRRE